jgi:uncharacterized phage protein gp47/JayE
MPTNVPSPVLGPNGFTAPAESTILAGVQEDQQAAFGSGLVIANADGTPNLTTPQGQLATSLTAIIGDKNDQFLALANGVDPAFASGRMQDAVGRIYFIERNPAEPTSVVATCTGLTGTPIPVGARAQDISGNIYICTEAGTIPASGSINLTFACTVTGPIACPAGQLNSIFQAIPGWDSVLNANPGVIGSDVESRADFENRRSQSVALNSKGSVPSVRGAVLSVTNVLDAYVTDNPTNAPATIGGVVVGPNTLYVCAAGGASQDIGNAIWTKKSPGCNTQGNTPVTVDDTDGYTPPFPQFTISYDTAASLPILFIVQIANDSTLPANITQLVQQAIANAFSGADGGQRARIGRRILASRFYIGVENIDPNVELLSIQIGTTTANANFVNVNINQIPTLDPSNITVQLV